MKRLLALLLCLVLVLPVLSAFAESDEEDLDVKELLELEEVDVDLDDEGNLQLKDDGDGSYFELSDEALEQMEELFTVDDSVDPEELELNGNLPDDYVNILLCGLDVKGTKNDKLLKDQGKYAKRADVQMVLSINRYDGSIKLTSFARNTYVDIPDRTNNSSICNSWGHAVYKNGKYDHWVDTPANCLRTVNRNFELNIEHYVAINFYGVVSIIELLGGADVELTSKEAAYINSYLKKHKKAISNSYDDKNGNREPLQKVDGVQHLDGLQALMYARTRELDNDLARTGRTRKLLSGLLTPTVAKLKSGELDAINLIAQCGQYLISDMNPKEMLEIVGIVMNSDIVRNMDLADSLIEEYRVPEDGAWSYGEDASGSSVVKLKNKQEAVELLHEFIYGAYYPAY